jgi:hypothetical protein
MGYEFSLHRSSGWKGQLERVERRHGRVKKAAKTGSVDLEDFVYAFFQNAFHLRDWIASECPKQKNRVFDLFKGQDALGICRDIANTTKHFKLTHKATVDQMISIAREYDPQAPKKYRLSVLADQKYDIISLADMCLDQIKDFCKDIDAEQRLQVTPHRTRHP